MLGLIYLKMLSVWFEVNCFDVSQFTFLLVSSYFYAEVSGVVFKIFKLILLRRGFGIRYLNSIVNAKLKYAKINFVSVLKGASKILNTFLGIFVFLFLRVEKRDVFT